MKLFRIDMAFCLPDDFEGGLREALDLMTAYLFDASHPGVQRQIPEEERAAFARFDELRWQRYRAAFEQGKRIAGFSDVQVFRDGRWVTLADATSLDSKGATGEPSKEPV